MFFSIKMLLVIGEFGNIEYLCARNCEKRLKSILLERCSSG